MTPLQGAKTLLVRTSQMAGLQGDGVVEGGGFEVVVAEGVVGVTQGRPGTFHWPAESEQLSTWPFGERQSLSGLLSQVPHCPSVFPPKKDIGRSIMIAESL